MRSRSQKGLDNSATRVDLELLERRDCPAVVSISGPNQVVENGQPVALTLSLSERQTKPVEVRYALAGTATAGQDYRLSVGGLGLRAPSGSVVFKPGITSLPITFTSLNDTIREGSETFQIILISARGQTLGQRSLSTTLLDDDSYTAALTGPARVAANASMTYTLQLSAPATRNDTFFITTEDRSATTGSDYNAVRNLPISFAPGQRSQQFRITTAAGSAASDRSFAITVRSRATDVPAVSPLLVTIEGTGLPPEPPAGPPLTTATFTHDYGWGIVNASASVAKLLGRTTAFPEVANRGGVNWGNDIVRAPEVWEQGYTGQGIVVAVVDTGVDYNHPSLRNSIWVNPREIPGDNIDNDNNGFVDDVRGWDFFGNDNDPMDSDGHGTHVAGTIAAVGTQFGPIGVALNAKIMPVVSHEYMGHPQELAAAIRYAATNGAHVINLSLKEFPAVEITDAISFATRLGSIVVVAAGNGREASPTFPASLASIPGVISVGAVNEDLDLGVWPQLGPNRGSARAGFSSSLKHVAAPGEDVTSTVPAGYTDPYYPVHVTPAGTFATFTGTSMAAPHVAGVVALMLSALPNPKAFGVRDRVVNALVSTAEQPPSPSITSLAAAGVGQPTPTSAQSGRPQITARSPSATQFAATTENARRGQAFSVLAHAHAASQEAVRTATPRPADVLESFILRRTARRGGNGLAQSHAAS